MIQQLISSIDVTLLVSTIIYLYIFQFAGVEQGLSLLGACLLARKSKAL